MLLFGISIPTSVPRTSEPTGAAADGCGARVAVVAMISVARRTPFESFCVVTEIVLLAGSWSRRTGAPFRRTTTFGETEIVRLPPSERIDIAEFALS
jgi:hypothetical protein